MVEYVDMHFATQLSGRLEQFKITNRAPLKINFRCPICNDSQKSKTKTRGWILENDNKLYVYCHNCFYGNSFAKFLKEMDPLLYNNYIADKFLKADKTPQKTKEVDFKQKKPVFNADPLKGATKVSSMKSTHPIHKYTLKRQIPSHQHYRLYYTQNFRAWVNTIIPNKFEIKGPDEPRLLMPFIDKKGIVFGVSARSFNPKGLRYISLMFDENHSKVFGLDKIDFTKPYVVCEGAIDSLFLSNAIAMAGAEGNTSFLEHPENAIFVFDKEPRNKEIVSRVKKLIDNGFKVCIWPSGLAGKDINEMWLHGHTDVENIIMKNTYKGLSATLKLADWKRI